VTAPQPRPEVVRAALIALSQDTMVPDLERADWRTVAVKASDHALCRLGRLLK
jgi:hypothetical protein